MSAAELRAPLIVCRDLALGYDGVPILSGVNLTVRAGDYLCVVGENGSGKSTFMKTLLHLKAPLRGEITLSGGLRRTEIGYLPQQTLVQRDFPASVREIVRSGCIARSGRRPFYTQEEKLLAEAAMEKMGILPLARRCYRELSGGQQQRVLLARALCAARRVLLLDEPVAGLDPKVTAEMYALIGRLNREDGITVLMISHDIQAALRHADHILHISHGRTWFGTTEEYRRTQLSRMFFGTEGGDPA